MGVNLVEASQAVDTELGPIDSPNWDVKPFAAGKAGYLFAAGSDSVYRAINRQLAAGKKIYRLAARDHEARVGDLFVPASEISHRQAEDLSQTLVLPVVALDEKPQGKALRIRGQRIGLFKPWVASMDEGWTRWLLEQYEFPYLSLNNDDVKEGSFADKVDVLLFADIDKNILANGEPDMKGRRRRWEPLPPRYSGGLEPEGSEQIETWVREGGTVVALDSSAQYFIDLFRLPVADVLAEAPRESLNIPGSMLRLEVDVEHPLGFGMRQNEAAYFASSPAFRTFTPDARINRNVVARYPADARDLALSGYVHGAELLAGRAAVVEFSVGKGKVVLIGFRAQHRAQPLRTFKLLFNALYLSGLEEEEI
jgi:hypothetical protein